MAADLIQYQLDTEKKVQQIEREKEAALKVAKFLQLVLYLWQWKWLAYQAII